MSGPFFLPGFLPFDVVAPEDKGAVMVSSSDSALPPQMIGAEKGTSSGFSNSKANRGQANEQEDV